MARKVVLSCGRKPMDLTGLTMLMDPTQQGRISSEDNIVLTLSMENLPRTVRRKEGFSNAAVLRKQENKLKYYCVAKNYTTGKISLKNE